MPDSGVGVAAGFRAEQPQIEDVVPQIVAKAMHERIDRASSVRVGRHGRSYFERFATNGSSAISATFRVNLISSPEILPL